MVMWSTMNSGAWSMLAWGYGFWISYHIWKHWKIPFGVCHYKYTHTLCLLDLLNTLRPRQKGRHFADNTFKCIFLNEDVRISIEISLKFVPNDPINNIPALVQIMAWHRAGDKSLSEPMMLSLLTHICNTLPQWVKEMPIYIYMLMVNVKGIYLEASAMELHDFYIHLSML